MKEGKRNKETKGREKGKRRSWRFWAGVFAAVLLSVIVLGIIVLPFAVEWTGERYLKEAGAIKADITDVNLNLFTGRLSILGLDVEGPNGDSISLDRFEADADILPLIKKRLRISDISLAGLDVDVRQSEDGTFTVGGLQAPAAAASADTQTEKEPVSLGFGFGIVDLYDIRINMTALDLDQTVAIKHLLVKDFATWDPESRTALLLNASMLGADLQLNGTVNPLAKEPAADIRYSIGELPLEQLNPYLENKSPAALTGKVNVRGQARLSLSPGSRSVSLQTSLTSGQVDTALRMGPDTILWKHENLSLDVNVSYMDTGTVSPANLKADANLSIEGVRVSESGSEGDLLDLGSLEIKEFLAEEAGKVKVSQVSLKEITLLTRPEEITREKEPGQVVRLGALTMTGIDLDNRYLLHISDVSLDSLAVWILLYEGGDLEPVKLLPVSTGKTSGEPAPEPDDGEDVPEPAMDIAVDSISLTGQNSFIFRDLNITPPMTFHIDSLKMEISDLNTNPSKGHAAVSLEASMGKYSSLNADGAVDAPWAEPDMDLRVKLRSLDLPNLTPYTDRYVGYILKSGHLDTDLDIKITKGKLDAQTEVVVNRIEMNPVKEEDEQRANERLGIPVKTALSLLKDKNDDIKLTLPIEGDLNDPDFRISDIVLTVTGNALKKGVSAFYGPLGATILTGGLLPPGTFSVLGKVFKGATTVSFDPVIFEPLESGLTDQHRRFLDQLAEKLTEKPDTRLILCGKVTRRDIMALRWRDFEALQASGTAASVAASTEPAAGLTSPPAGPPSIEEAPLADEEKERLIELAKQRALAVKDYLAEAGGLEPERLFVCYSDLEKEEGGPPPRVDLSI